jgi:DNA mismatch repair protein MutS
MESTPMLDQYRRLKAEHPGTILFFRMGDFYETFGEDALIASRVLGIALTSRDKKKDGSLPLAGVPHHAVEGYLRTLVRQGHSVAIAEQMEPAAEARGLVDRQIVEVLTPGTITRTGILNAVDSNYIVALHPAADRIGVSVAEVSTGEFRVGEVAREDLPALLLEFPSREIVFPEGAAAELGGSEITRHGGARVTRWDAARFDVRAGRQALERKFQVQSLDAFGLGEPGLGFGAAGALLDYLRSLKKSDLPQIGTVRPIREGPTLVVDEVTLRNLEILESQAGPEHTLLHLLDRTETAMGGRALRALLRAPGAELGLLNARLDRTEAFAASPRLRAEMRERLHRMPDLERALGLLGSGRASPRDLGTLRDALLRLPGVAKTLESYRNPVTEAWRSALPDLSVPASELGRALADELPLVATQGGIIREGYDPVLDERRRDASDSRSQVLALEASERARTGIPNLKVGFNRVFGYYLEVTRSHLGRVPPDYVRRQTLTGAERFVTPDLSRMEERIEASSVESHRLETEHFQRLRDLATREMSRIQSAARVLAALDLHLALGECAARERWVRPALAEDRELRLVASRHPMVERSLEAGAFQPNDVVLDPDEEQIWLITGPNMGGKSTFLRQVGLAVYLAHIGSFVPCAEARIGLVDRIFTRVGASDQIARGASTFFVEMQETATILRQASDRSLVLLDEVGRGTSTYDGLSLAWAVTETLHDGPGPRPRTLFATHYHELTDLESKLPRLRNRTVRVEERGHEIVFLHALAPGRADRSYGIHVAKLAGVPENVLSRAREILARLEAGDRAPQEPLGTDEAGSRRDDEARAPSAMAQRFDAALANELARVSVESMTPLDALNELARLRDRAQKSREH